MGRRCAPTVPIIEPIQRNDTDEEDEDAREGPYRLGNAEKG